MLRRYPGIFHVIGDGKLKGQLCFEGDEVIRLVHAFGAGGEIRFVGVVEAVAHQYGAGQFPREEVAELAVEGVVDLRRLFHGGEFFGRIGAEHAAHGQQNPSAVAVEDDRLSDDVLHGVEGEGVACPEVSVFVEGRLGQFVPAEGVKQEGGDDDLVVFKGGEVCFRRQQLDAEVRRALREVVDVRTVVAHAG